MTQEEFAKLDHEMIMANIHSRRAIYETILREQRVTCFEEIIKRLAGKDNYPLGTFQAIEESCLNAQWKY